MKHVSVRISEEIFNKLRKIANHEYRSINSQIYIIIREYIKCYEEEHGIIEENAPE